jgi:V8-like Glu-specific endopeptidase
MTYFLPLILLIVTAQVHAKMDVVYGQDNRIDLYQETNPLIKKLASGVAAMVSNQFIKPSLKPDFYQFMNVRSMEKSMNVCSTEAFARQPIVSECSGFLVGPDTLVTAGHCYSMINTPVENCRDNFWVFDYSMKSASSNPTRNIPAKNVYRCKQVITSQFTKKLDFTIIKLDRVVEGRAPLKYKTRGTITPTTPLVVIGHPSGLPLKISDAGRVVKNKDKNRFSTTLDTFHGNSGSAVFDATNGEIVGILIEGKTDYVPSIDRDPDSCQVVNHCSTTGQHCASGNIKGPQQWGEVVLRMEVIAEAVTKGVRAH